MTQDDWRATAAKLGLNVVPWKFTTELPDGGRVEVTDPTLVPMGGDAAAHRQLTYTRDGDAERPGCTIVFEIRNEVPICVSIHLWSSENSQTHVRTRDLKAIKLDNLLHDIYAYTGVWMPNPDGGWMRKLGWTPFLEDRKRVERATQRRKITPEFLDRVAEIHDSAPAGGRLEAVKAAFGVSERQALRYIAQAKQKGK